MSSLLAARVQMADSLMFHIIFSVLSIGLPLLLCIAEGLALWHKDPVWMACRWLSNWRLLARSFFLPQPC